MASTSASASASASPRLNTTTPTIVSANLTEAVDEEYEDLPPDSPSFTMIPDLFTSPPAIQDALSTLTSRAQDATMHECLPFLRGQVEHYEETDRHKHEGHLDASGRVNRHGVPRLDRERHVRFLHRTLGPLPSVFIGADASRPWMLYWALSALALLGEEVSPSSALGMGLVETARSMQNADTTGGFGGGHGQLSHLATSYAVVLALAVVGGPDAFEVVDRRAMWRWLCQLKMPNGGFRMSIGGEEGVRGCYCAVVIATLLNLPLDLAPTSPGYRGEGSTLFTCLADYIRSCQTYEGGISDRPDGEAHGAFTFCGLGCLAIMDAPYRIFPKYLDMPRLIAWLSSRQYAPEGGFSGRTNKLVDGCYSHWVGGCWPLIDACLQGQDLLKAEERDPAATLLVPNDESIMSREGIIRYILCCCQDQTKRGGLRDKPSRPSDAYHTAYVLAGLSAAQHTWSPPTRDENAWTTVFPYLDDVQIYENVDRLRTVHPVYVIPPRKAEEMMAYFKAKESF